MPVPTSTATPLPLPPPSEILIPISERAAYLGRVHVGVTIPLMVLCLVPLVIRLYVRVRPVWRVGWDDWFIVLGCMLTITDWVLLQHKIFTMPQNITVARAMQGMKLSYLSISVWGAAITSIKISVALTLLRIPVNRAWVVFLWSITGVQVAYFVANTIYIFHLCRPLAALWDFSIPNAVCLSPQTSSIASNVGSSINIITDFSLSLAPMRLLWNLHRPLRERVLVCALMATGLLAGVACIVKAVALREWTDITIDPWALSATIATWTMIELQVALLAACSPSLKGPLQRLLGRCGVLLTHYGSVYNISFVRGRAGGRSFGLGPRIERDCANNEVKAPPLAHFRRAGDDDLDGTTDADADTNSSSLPSSSLSDCRKQSATSTRVNEKNNAYPV